MVSVVILLQLIKKHGIHDIHYTLKESTICRVILTRDWTLGSCVKKQCYVGLSILLLAI